MTDHVRKRHTWVTTTCTKGSAGCGKGYKRNSKEEEKVCEGKSCGRKCLKFWEEI